MSTEVITALATALVTLLFTAAGLYLAIKWNMQKYIATQLDAQDTLRKAELDPIKKQVDNHIPSTMDKIKNELKADAKETKSELKADIRETKSELKADIRGISTKIDALIIHLISVPHPPHQTCRHRYPTPPTEITPLLVQ